MRRVIMWNIMSLDGFIEAPGRDISWHGQIWNEELETLSNDQLGAGGGLIFGRVTYELMANYWPAAEGTDEDKTASFMNAMPKIVFSRTLTSSPWNNTRFVKGDAVKEVAALKQGEGKDLYIFGSADLCGQLIPAGMIDELRVGIAPLMLGAGTPLFKPMSLQPTFRLLNTQTTQKGLAILRYAPV